MGNIAKLLSRVRNKLDTARGRLCGAVIDQNKCFDRLDPRQLIAVLLAIGVPKYLVAPLQRFYDDLYVLFKNRHATNLSLIHI